MLLWLSSVYWVRTLNTPGWDILATDVAVYFDSKLRKLKLQTYQSISPAKVSCCYFSVINSVEKNFLRARKNSSKCCENGIACLRKGRLHQ